MEAEAAVFKVLNMPGRQMANILIDDSRLELLQTSGEKLKPSGVYTASIVETIKGRKKVYRATSKIKEFKGKPAKKNKHNAQATILHGVRYHSKFEAEVAQDLIYQKRAGMIRDFENQFKVEMEVFTKCGNRSIVLSHKIDFRVHNLDGSYTLLEAKGYETADYKMRRKWIESLWLPFYPDHSYEVRYNKK